jgi:hypothetical protein
VGGDNFLDRLCSAVRRRKAFRGLSIGTRLRDYPSRPAADSLWPCRQGEAGGRCVRRVRVDSVSARPPRAIQFFNSSPAHPKSGTELQNFACSATGDVQNPRCATIELKRAQTSGFLAISFGLGSRPRGLVRSSAWNFDRRARCRFSHRFRRIHLRGEGSDGGRRSSTVGQHPTFS